MRLLDMIDENVKKVLYKLEDKDLEERVNEVDKSLRLRQIPRETGEFLYQFLSIHSSTYQPWNGLEIGSSGGYSTIWQGLALKSSANGHLQSFDIDEQKVNLAQENVVKARLESYVTINHLNAKDYINSIENQTLNYVFLDAEKEDYISFFNLIESKMKIGSVLIADNLISHKKDLKPFLELVENNADVLANVLSIGKGLAFIRWV